MCRKIRVIKQRNNKTKAVHPMNRTKTLVRRKFIEFFIPTVLTTMANSIAMLVDATIVNITLGNDAFASVNLMSPIVQIYVAISILFGLSSATIIAKIKGENKSDTQKSNGIFTQAFMMLAVISAVLMVVQLALADRIVALLTPDPTLQQLTKSYYTPMILGTPITLLMISGVYLIRTEGRPQFASAIILVSNLVNLIFDFVLISGFRLEITGASIATVLGNLVGLVMFLSHFRRKDCTIHFSLKSMGSFRHFFTGLKELLSYGISGTLGAVLIMVKMLFLNGLVQQFGGSTALVAFSVVSLCQIFDSAFVAGACQTMVALSSMLYGEGDSDGIKFSFNQALRLLLISTISIMLILLAFAQPIVTAYGMKEAEAMSIGMNALRICVLSLPGDALTFIMLYHYISVGRNRWSTVISVLNGALVIPAGIVLSKAFNLTGVWMAIPAAQYLTLCCVFVKLLLDKSKRPLFGEKAGSHEICSFSLNGTAPEQEKSHLNHLTEEISGHFTALPEEMLMNMLDYLRILCDAPLEKGRKTQDTDVRICEDAVIIKNMGANVCENDFKNAAYSKALGINVIRAEFPAS